MSFEQYDLRPLPLPTMRAASSSPIPRIRTPDYEHDEAALNRRTVRKLDTILLPFLALLFLFNSLDKSNIGNAETANFTSDIGLSREDLNTAVAIFYAFFVTLQPVGAALGRKYGMAVWVPGCMAVWGLCTMLHVWVRAKWQLIFLRMIIGSLEAGFYPTTVSYLSLFYTRYEFAKRLALFYGQSTVAGALGGILSYAVFSLFPTPDPGNGDNLNQRSDGGWKPWQMLFLLEGATTIILAVLGFFWLPHSARTAWFLSPAERIWADERIQRDRSDTTDPPHHTKLNSTTPSADEAIPAPSSPSSEEAQAFLSSSTPTLPSSPSTSAGLPPHSILSALTDWKTWYLLTCNILSSIPATTLPIFLPLILRPLSPSPATTNLLTAPPFLLAALSLWTFTAHSDRRQERLRPILLSLSLLAAGLAAVAILPPPWPKLRYAALCVLLSGAFVPSPLQVAWIAGNTPEPGKRAVVLGINGWGNVAGVLGAVLFRPEGAETGYRGAFGVTLGGVVVAAGGYARFRGWVVRENGRRRRGGVGWEVMDWVVGLRWVPMGVKRWVDEARRQGRGRDESGTFRFGL